MPTSSTPWTLDRTLPSDPDVCADVMRVMVDALTDRDWSDKEVFGLHMAMEEAIQNAVRHGNQCSPDKTVELTITITDDSFEATVTDQGNGFDPAGVPCPTDDANLDRCSGRGLALINNYADEATYNATGNSLTIKKRKRDER
jgi:serine/threonine-protein kinase RsbW